LKKRTKKLLGYRYADVRLPERVTEWCNSGKKNSFSLLFSKKGRLGPCAER
jgi:hypothetical protein